MFDTRRFSNKIKLILLDFIEVGNIVRYIGNISGGLKDEMGETHN